MQYFIKNMVCNRCIMVVQQLFEELGNPPVRISLGEVETANPILHDDLEKLRKKVVSYGFELIDDTKSQLIEKIKNTIIRLVHHSTLFSEVEGTTIEKYIILQKIERVKELLVYDELTVSEIADKMGYSNVAYLSSQFKKVTGLTPSHFKQVKENKRKPLDEV